MQIVYGKDCLILSKIRNWYAQGTANQFHEMYFGEGFVQATIKENVSFYQSCK